MNNFICRRKQSQTLFHAAKIDHNKISGHCKKITTTKIGRKITSKIVQQFFFQKYGGGGGKSGNWDLFCAVGRF